MKLAKLTDETVHLALAKLSKEPLPLRTAFKLKGIIKASRDEFSKYEELRKEALQRYGEKNEDGSLKVDERSNVVFSPEGIQAFAGAINELAQIDVSIPTLALSELGDKVVLTAEELGALDSIVIDG